ncbi:hypothetical protein [Nocardioides sp. Leaf307]|uniref:hypothetical protein n=1 Tax=Nocardioides sp. Leaf307 TaxID=1736331 RepID=UPI0012EAF6C2|nr:hypothetical protein [Nocardioides sp. Leaf307]
MKAPDADSALVQSCFEQAVALVTRTNRVWNADTKTYVASAAPVAIVDRAVLAVGAELYNQRNTKNGVAQFAAFDEAPVRVARDPMVAAYPLLSPWVVFI